MKRLLCFIALLLAINANAATYFFNRFTTNAETAVGNMTLSGLSVTGAVPGTIKLTDANGGLRAQIGTNDNFFLSNSVTAWTIQATNGGISASSNITAQSMSVASAGKYYFGGTGGAYMQFDSGTGTLSVSGPFTSPGIITGLSFSGSGISNGIYGIKISSTTGVGIGMANEGYGAGSLELLTDLVIGQDANIGRNAFISGSGYIGIGNRTAFRSDGNGQLRIFAANVSSAGGLGADVFLGTTTATNGFITVTNSAQTLSAITFPLTTVKWTNNFGMNIVLYIDNSGVTGTSVSKNNQQIFSSLVGDMTICLKPGDYFAVAYTLGTPVARWEPQ